MPQVPPLPPKPLGGRILVKPHFEDLGNGVIEVVKDGSEKSDRGTILDIGDGYTAWAKKTGCTLDIGNAVWFEAFGAEVVEGYYTVPFENVLMVGDPKEL